MNPEFPITIYHNAKCGTSRNALAIITAAGHAPTVVEYLTVGWTRAGLNELMSRSGLSAREFLREKEPWAAKLGLLAPEVSPDTIIEAMIAHPELVNRPIVATPLGVRLCRPSERVLDLLDRRSEAFTKEDGEVVIHAGMAVLSSPET